MAQEYLPAPSNVRLADLMKEHNISQPELAKELGCSKSIFFLAVFAFFTVTISSFTAMMFCIFFT